MDLEERIAAKRNQVVSETNKPQETPVEDKSVSTQPATTAPIPQPPKVEKKSFFEMANAVVSTEQDAQLSNRLGIKGTVATIVHVQKSDVQVLDIPIKDVDGKFSARVLEFASNFGIHIVPSKYVKNVPKNVELNSYTRVDYEGEEYLVPKQFNTDILTPVMKEVIKRLENGENFSASVFRTFNLGADLAKTLFLSPKQLQDLYTMFSNFNPKLIKTEADLIFCVGEFE